MFQVVRNAATHLPTKAICHGPTHLGPLFYNTVQLKDSTLTPGLSLALALATGCDHQFLQKPSPVGVINLHGSKRGPNHQGKHSQPGEALVKARSVT